MSTMKMNGQLAIYDPTNLPAVLPKPFHRDPFFHQTGNLKSILGKGWDVAHRSGMRRLYGDGVYFAHPGRFWPTQNGHVIEARLDLTAQLAFASPEEFAKYVAGQGLNNQNDAHQARIADYFLKAGVKCISFPEEVGADAVLNQLLGTPNRTFVVYDPSIIFVTGIA